MLRLINAIEVSPYDYAKEDYEYPAGTSAKSPSARNSYWKKCIADSNLGALKAIEEGAYLVDIETIDFPELEEIIKKKLSEVEPDDFEEQIGRLSGGIVVTIENKVVIEPNCCADIGNLENWEGIFTSAVDCWQQLWIGHPWFFYRRRAGMIDFSDYTEYFNPDELASINTRCSISEDDLILQVKNSRRQQEAFETRILFVLQSIKIDNAAAIARLLTGNNQSPPTVAQ